MSSAADSASVGPDDFRLQVMSEAIRLFETNGYESTTVDQVASTVGISRRTFFRQFGSKEDVIFADHESLLRRVSAYFDSYVGDPWSAPVHAAEIVFRHFFDARPLAVRRFAVVQAVPVLRDRELVTTYRYQRLFEEYLRSALPNESPAHLAGYAAAVTGAHNYVLRAMIRGDDAASLDLLRAELNRIEVSLPSSTTGSAEVTVVSYPPGTDPDDVARRVAEQLHAHRR